MLTASRKRMLACLCVLLVGACDESSPLGPKQAINERVTVAPGQSVVIRGTSLRLQFLRVSGDSRCPADAFCIQGGDAIVHLRATETTSAEYELHIGDAALAVAMHDGFRIELVQLQPYPFSSQSIAPGDYRATIGVEH